MPGAIRTRTSTFRARIGSLVRAIEQSDQAKIEQAITRLSGSRRALSPLVFAVGAFALLFDGLKLLLSNWRLTVVQILPAAWIWVAMSDFKLHTFRGEEFTVVLGPVLIPIILVIVVITTASFFLNGVFAFAISRPGRPEVRPGFDDAWRHRRAILGSGAILGLMLAFSTVVVTRWGRPWFAIALGITIALMMTAYVAVPARLIGVKPTHSKRDKLMTTVVGGVLGATVSAPPYILGRIGILMLGSSVLLIPGIIVVAIGVTLQAGATGAVRAIKMSVSLGAGGPPHDDSQDPDPDQIRDGSD